MGLFSKIIGKGTPKMAGYLQAQDDMIPSIRKLGPWRKQFAAQTMETAASALLKISEDPALAALDLEMLTAKQSMMFYKLIYAYFWMTLFFLDPRAKREMRIMLTLITDRDSSHTRHICDELELAYDPESNTDPRFQLGQKAWDMISQTIPTRIHSKNMMNLFMPIFFDNFHLSVSSLIQMGMPFDP